MLSAGSLAAIAKLVIKMLGMGSDEAPSQSKAAASATSSTSAKESELFEKASA